MQENKLIKKKLNGRHSLCKIAELRPKRFHYENPVHVIVLEYFCPVLALSQLGRNYVTFSVGFTEVPPDHLSGFHLPELHILYSFQVFHSQYQLKNTHRSIKLNDWSENISWHHHNRQQVKMPSMIRYMIFLFSTGLYFSSSFELDILRQHLSEIC